MLITRILTYHVVFPPQILKFFEDNHSVCMDHEELYIPIGKKMVCQQEDGGVERTVAIIIMSKGPNC